MRIARFEPSTIDVTVAELIGDQLPSLARADTVFIKPNLTYPRPEPGVTTTPLVLESIIRVLRDFGVRRIFVGEGEGGYNSFDMLSTLESMGASHWRERYDVESGVINEWPSRSITVQNRHGSFSANFPAALWEYDVVLTVPVPKVHAMTTISGAVKNQWGLLQDPMRLRHHLALCEILLALHDSLPAVRVIVDGTYGLTDNGPMIEGRMLELGWLGACNDVWECDATLSSLMGFTVSQVPYLAYAARQGRSIVPDSATAREFFNPEFGLAVNGWNRLAKITWHSRALNHLVYFSGASGLLHRIMYLIRHAPEELSVRGRDW